MTGHATTSLAWSDGTIWRVHRDAPREQVNSEAQV
jgi:hypothetical protein